MPAQKAKASFEPIPPDLDLKALVETTPNFSYVDRLSCATLDPQDHATFETTVTRHVIKAGKPLVIDGFEDRLDPWTFTPKWLRDNCGDRIENACNLTSKENLPLTMGHYLKNMSLLTNQFFEKPGAHREKNRQRVYLKDIDCPPVWWDKLKEHIPAPVAYLNDSTADIGGPGAKPDPHSTVPGRMGKGIARAGDLMSSLPPDMRAENLMCYIGHEGTYTPAHREMCASLGQNIMVEASNTVSEDGKAEKPGSSIWFMTESKDRHLVSEYWLDVLGHDIEVETHFAQVIAWKKAPFRVYVVEQRPGDFILIPPLAPHQVWNRGTRTIKVAWNRTTVETLEMALNEALPRSRIVCRDEQYKNKAIIYYTLQKYSSLLMEAQRQCQMMSRESIKQFLYCGKLKQLIKDFKRLFNLYKQVLLTETFNPEERDVPKNIDYLPFDSNVTCAYCRGNIFNRFLTCPHCKDLLGHHDANEDGDPYDVCMDCYVMGRSCACTSGLRWVEQFKWKELVSKYEAWRKLIIDLDGGSITSKTPLSLLDERRRYGKKTLAELCKEQLKRRPFKDVKKPQEPKDCEESEEEIVVTDDGTVKKIKAIRSKTWLKNNKTCHVCCKRHPIWKMAQCTTCERGWCYGSLFRGWDKMPLEIMENPDWECPHCLGICFAGNCRREGKMRPYEPKGTLLGHDTKKVADVRSVEALVDFSVSNLNWLKDDDPANRTESRRFKRARAEAEREKMDPSMNGNDDDQDEDEQVTDKAQVGMLDPALGGDLVPEGGRQPLVGHKVEGTLVDEDANSDAMLAQTLHKVNASLPAPSALMASAPSTLPEGYAALTSAGYSACPPTGNAHMYPAPNEATASYPYPSQGLYQDELPSGSKRHRGHSNGEYGDEAKGEAEAEDDENIAMLKGPRQKKPRLTAAGFRSIDLAKEAVGPMTSKAKTEAQRQFEKEKERKALEKAKAQGRFIMLQAAIKNKKRIIKFRIPGNRLAQVLAQKADIVTTMGDSRVDAEHTILGGATQTEEFDKDVRDNSLLKSDILSKADRKQKVRVGITGNTKKALVPVEEDDNYQENAREKGLDKTLGLYTAAMGKTKKKGNGRKARGSQNYEEVDIGSDSDFAENDFNSVNNSTMNINPKRRSLPGYLQNRHADDNDDDATPPELLPQSAPRKATGRPSRGGIRPFVAPPAASPSSGRSEEAVVAARSMSEENRLAKLRALQMLDEDLDIGGGSSASGRKVSFGDSGVKMADNAESIDDDDEDDDDDDEEADEIPAK